MLPFPFFALYLFFIISDSIYNGYLSKTGRNISLDAWRTLSWSLQGKAFWDSRSLVSAENMHQDKVTLPMALYRYCQEIINPPCELSVYARPFKNIDPDLLGYLCIDNITHFEAHDLLSLAGLQSLAVLELIARDPASEGITDRTIRGWSEVKPVAFPHLRVLRIISRTHAVSETSLRYVLAFPRLNIFDVTALPDSKWQNAAGIAGVSGWKATEPQPEDSLFVSYADAYLDGRVAVQMTGAEGLRPLFEDDGKQISFGYDPRAGFYAGESKDEDVGRLDLRTYLDDGWRALLQGDHLNSQQSRERPHRGEMSDNDAFWFMALLGQQEYDRDTVSQAQVAGVTLQPQRFVSLRLCSASNPSEQQRQLLNSDRIIFSRTTPIITDTLKSSVQGSGQGSGSGSGSGRTSQTIRRHRKERSVTDLKPRKRQNLGDMLSSFSVPQGGPK
jgi:hypothetical protein